MHHLRIKILACIISTALFSLSRSHSTERNPLNYYSEVHNPRFSTPAQRIHAGSKFELEFALHGGEQNIRLTLTPNHAILQEGATVQYLAPDGSLRSSELIDRSEYRIFKGNAWLRHYEGAEWTNVGWARIMVQKDGKNPIFEGAFRIDGDHHHVQTGTHFMQTRHKLDPILDVSEEEMMVVWRDSDISDGVKIDDSNGVIHSELRRSLGEDHSCSADGLSFNTRLDHPIYAGMKRRGDDSSWSSVYTRSVLWGRQMDGQLGGNSAGVNLISSLGSTAGCPSTRKVALVGVATDCTYTTAFNSTAAARANIINVFNTASQQYESTFNITLGIRNLTISDASCPPSAPSAAPWNVPCSDSVTIQDRLNLFSAWRGERNDNNAYWTLLSTCATGSAVGLAWLGQACVATASVTSASANNETVSGANVVVRTGSEWQVIAHETGHTFGAVHDCTSVTCNDGTTVTSQQCCPLSASTCDAAGAFLMNPSTGSSIQKFSPCTIGNICSAIGRNSVKTSCLTANKDVTTITGSQCGNGIVEAGEDCDCGGTADCGNNPCCNPTTCKFQANAVCDPSNEDCCSSTCQFKSAGSVCRASTGVCDPQETCSGTSATCPNDATAVDGTICGNSSASLACASGQCTSRDLQCKTLMGSITKENDTYACSSNGCQISCAFPEVGANVCYSMQQNFLDGTSCQGGGQCSNGQCKGVSFGKEITSWIKHNMTLVIAIAASFGGLLGLVLLSCCISNYRRRRNYARGKRLPSQKTSTYAKHISPAWDGLSSWQHGPSEPRRGQWIDDRRFVTEPQPAWQKNTIYR